MEVLQRTANRGSISTGYDIDNSLKLNSASSEYLYITRDASGSDWNRLLWTASMWVKHIPTESSATSPKERMFGAADAQSDFDIRFRGQPIGFRNNSDVDGVAELRTTAVYRDYSSWYHVVAVWDTANGTAGNRMRLYVNGEEVTSFSTDTQPSQNEKSIWGKKNDGTDGDVAHTIGAYYNASSGFAQGFNGYMAEVHWVEGAALAPTEFGEVDSASGIWKPKEADVTYGTNGFYLNFDDSSALGADSSGNSNNWSLNNIAAADQATDTPTNNFCTINTPFEPLVGGPPTITEGATIMTAGSSGQQDSYGTMALFKGKWYFEFSVLNVGGLAIANMFGGVVKVNRLLQSSYNNAANGHHSHDGGWGGGVNAVGVHSASGSGFSAVSGSAVDVVVGVAVDMDNGKIWWASGGTYASSSGTVSNPATATLPQFTNLLTQYPGEPVVPAFNHYVHQATTQGAFNFGNPFDHAFTDIGTNSDANGYGSFAYTPPSGYYAICSKNLAEYG